VEIQDQKYQQISRLKKVEEISKQKKKEIALEKFYKFLDNIDPDNIPTTE